LFENAATPFVNFKYKKFLLKRARVVHSLLAKQKEGTFVVVGVQGHRAINWYVNDTWEWRRQRDDTLTVVSLGTRSGNAMVLPRSFEGIRKNGGVIDSRAQLYFFQLFGAVRNDTESRCMAEGVIFPSGVLAKSYGQLCRRIQKP